MAFFIFAGVGLLTSVCKRCFFFGGLVRLRAKRGIFINHHSNFQGVQAIGFFETKHMIFCFVRIKEQRKV